MDVSSLGLELYARGRLDESTATPGGAVALAIGLYGVDSIVSVDGDGAPELASVARVGSTVRISIRSGVTVQRSNFLIALMVARAELATRRCTEIASQRALAAWLVAPPQAVVAHVCDLSKLARSFAVTETCAALRLGESGVAGVIVITPEQVHRRGGPLCGMSDAQIRRLSEVRLPKDITAIHLVDEPGRVALLARA